MSVECPSRLGCLTSSLSRSQSCLQLDPMARPTAKDCFTIIKRCMRDGFSDEPHSVGSGVPSVVVRSQLVLRALHLQCSISSSDLRHR